MPSSSPMPLPNWPTTSLMSSSLRPEVNSFLKVSEPFPGSRQHPELLAGLSRRLSFRSSSRRWLPAPTFRLHGTRNAGQTGYWRHGQLREQAHRGGDTGARDQRCGQNLQPELLPEPAQSHRSGPLSVMGGPSPCLPVGWLPLLLPPAWTCPQSQGILAAKNRCPWESQQAQPHLAIQHDRSWKSLTKCMGFCFALSPLFSNIGAI